MAFSQAKRAFGQREREARTAEAGDAMNTLRIADALENFGESGRGHDASGEAVAAHSVAPRHVPRPQTYAPPIPEVPNAKKRSASSESLYSKLRAEGVRQALNPYKYRTSPQNKAQHRKCDVAGRANFQTCLPRYSTQGSDLLGQDDKEIALLRSRVSVNHTDFNLEYDLGGTIGQGTFGKVKKATDKKTGQVVAVKMLGGKSFGTNELRAFLNECDILCEIDHANVPILHGIYECSRKYTMIMEYASGGELFERIQSQGSFNEEAAANITRQLLSVLQYIHDKRIAHRDLKPENILFADCERDLGKATVKLIDFGFAKRMAPHDAPPPREAQPKVAQSSFQTRLGSPNYVAPEILTSKIGYGVEVDVWSLGVILYIMLCGYFPFYHENERELYRQIRKGSFDMPAEDWSHVSDAAKDLVNSMLKTDPRLRASASDCLRHPWIAKPGVASKQPFPQASRDKLDMFLDKQKKIPKLKKVMDKVFNPFRQSPKKNDRVDQAPSDTAAGALAGGAGGRGGEDARGREIAMTHQGQAPRLESNPFDTQSKESITSPLYYGKGPSTPRKAPGGCAGNCCIQ